MKRSNQSTDSKNTKKQKKHGVSIHPSLISSSSPREELSRVLSAIDERFTQPEALDTRKLLKDIDKHPTITLFAKAGYGKSMLANLIATDFLYKDLPIPSDAMHMSSGLTSCAIELVYSDDYSFEEHYYTEEERKRANRANTTSKEPSTDELIKIIECGECRDLFQAMKRVKPMLERPNLSQSIKKIVLKLPFPGLKSGLVLRDIPGYDDTSGDESAKKQFIREALSESDIVLCGFENQAMAPDAFIFDKLYSYGFPSLNTLSICFFANSRKTDSTRYSEVVDEFEKTLCEKYDAMFCDSYGLSASKGAKFSIPRSVTSRIRKSLRVYLVPNVGTDQERNPLQNPLLSLKNSLVSSFEQAKREKVLAIAQEKLIAAGFMAYLRAAFHNVDSRESPSEIQQALKKAWRKVCDDLSNYYPHVDDPEKYFLIDIDAWLRSAMVSEMTRIVERHQVGTVPLSAIKLLSFPIEHLSYELNRSLFTLIRESNEKQLLVDQLTDLLSGRVSKNSVSHEALRAISLIEGHRNAIDSIIDKFDTVAKFSDIDALVNDISLATEMNGKRITQDNTQHKETRRNKIHPIPPHQEPTVPSKKSFPELVRYGLLNERSGSARLVGECPFVDPYQIATVRTQSRDRLIKIMRRDKHIELEIPHSFAHKEERPIFLISDKPEFPKVSGRIVFWVTKHPNPVSEWNNDDLFTISIDEDLSKGMILTCILSFAKELKFPGVYIMDGLLNKIRVFDPFQKEFIDDDTNSVFNFIESIDRSYVQSNQTSETDAKYSLSSPIPDTFAVEITNLIDQKSINTTEDEAELLTSMRDKIIKKGSILDLIRACIMAIEGKQKRKDYEKRLNELLGPNGSTTDLISFLDTVKESVMVAEIAKKIIYSASNSLQVGRITILPSSELKTIESSCPTLLCDNGANYRFVNSSSRFVYYNIDKIGSIQIIDKLWSSKSKDSENSKFDSYPDESLSIQMMYNGLLSIQVIAYYYE